MGLQWAYNQDMKCKCGCGKRTRISPRNRKELGHIKGKPVDYIHGHSTKVKWADGLYDNRGEDWRANISASRIKNGVASGKNNPNWQGGLTEKQVVIRSHTKYKNWRKKVYERDNYRCIMCLVAGNGKNLEADHIIPLSILIRDKKYLWDIDNGRTLCKDCHRKTDSYGWKATNNYLRKFTI